MKKALAMILGCTMAAMLLSACGKGTAPEPSVTAPGSVDTQPASGDSQSTSGDWGNLRIGHLTERLGDQGFNDGCYEGVKRFADEYGCEMTVVEIPELNDYAINARNFAQEGYDILVLTTAAAVDLVKPVAEEFPETQFIITGGVTTGLKNLTSFEFAQFENGFVAGAFAALMNKELGGELKSGFVSGVRNPAMERSQYGFTAGSEYAGGTCTVVYVGDWNDAAKGKEIAMQMYSDGIKVVQAFAGGAGNGVYQAAETKGAGYYSMGNAGGHFELSDTIIASMLQSNGDAFYELCRKAAAGELDGSAGVSLLDMKSGVVAFGYNPKNEALVPQTIKDQVAEIEAKVKSGELVPPQTEAEYKAFQENVINNKK